MEIICCLTLSNGYVVFFDHFLKSIIRNNPWFDKKFIIFCDERLCQENRDYLLSLYKNIIFHKVNSEYYESYYKGSIKFYSFECFLMKELYNVDRVIYFGADMLCLGDIKDLFDVAETIDTIGMSRELRRMTEPFNNGSMILGDKFMTRENYEGLMKANYDSIPCQLKDQKYLNHFFKGRIVETSRKWNVMVSEVDNIKDVKILHYIYKVTNECGYRHLTSELIKLWTDYDNKPERMSGIVG